MSVSERIKFIFDEKGETVYSFSKKYNIPQRRLSRQVNEGNTITEETFITIAKVFPDISLNWIVTGEGKKYIENNKENKDITTEKKDFDHSSINNKSSREMETIKFLNSRIEELATENGQLKAKIELMESLYEKPLKKGINS